MRAVAIILTVLLCACADRQAEADYKKTIAVIDARIAELKQECLKWGKPYRARVYLARKFRYMTRTPCLKYAEPAVAQEDQ
jgi:hypothetical protein